MPTSSSKGEQMKELFLKFLGKIYYHTGLYLGKHWEEKHIAKNMKKFRRNWIKHYTIGCPIKDRMSFECYLGISRGMWQSKYGFVRKFNWK